jgi:hypothetical protein
LISMKSFLFGYKIKSWKFFRSYNLQIKDVNDSVHPAA